LEAHVSRGVETPAQNEQQQEQTAQYVFQLATGYIVSTALQVAMQLRIADRIADGPRSTAELAHECGGCEDALYRVLRALASVGVFEEVAVRRFGLNPAAAMLRSDAPGSLYDMVRWISDPFHLRVYADVMHSVKTGETAVNKAVGMEVFDYFAQNPELSRVFNNAMTSFSAMVVPAALEAYDFSGIRVLVDVAGGHGGLLTGVLDRHPAMRGILCDLDHVIAGAKKRIASIGLQGRVDCVTTDIFAAVPEGGDAYLMKHIIHDWDDARAGLILRNIRKVLPKNGRVILLEAVVAPGNAPDFGKILDLEMLLLPGGRERTADEFRALFAANGFELTRIVPTKSPLAVIEAVASNQ
jgi:hypothetical protein